MWTNVNTPVRSCKWVNFWKISRWAAISLQDFTLVVHQNDFLNKMWFQKSKNLCEKSPSEWPWHYLKAFDRSEKAVSSLQLRGQTRCPQEDGVSGEPPNTCRLWWRWWNKNPSDPAARWLNCKTAKLPGETKMPPPRQPRFPRIEDTEGIPPTSHLVRGGRLGERGRQEVSCCELWSGV